MNGNDITAADITWELPANAYHHVDQDDFLVDLVLEAKIYREALQQALHLLHQQQLELTRLREALARERQQHGALMRRVLAEARP